MSKAGLSRDYIRLMHFPLPLCVISFTTIGALLSPVFHLDRLLWTYLIVLFSLCLASYCFDELKGRPWNTKIPENQLKILGWLGLVLSLALGVCLALTINLALLLWIPPSVFVILAYNMELFNGRFHNGPFFALGWGGIPTLGSYFLQAITITPTVIIVAVGTIIYSLAIWTLTHEFRDDMDRLREDLAKTPDSALGVSLRRSRKGIWKITRILCYSIVVFTIALSVYRFNFLP